MLAGLALVNRAVQAHRIAAGDPDAHAVGRAQLIAARVGVGEGEQVADGRWAHARAVPAPNRRRRRAAILEPQARMAALLGARMPELVAEELVLRVRGDLDAGRPRHAALGLLVALDAAIAELAADPSAPELAPRLAELRQAREAVGAAAQTALTGAPDEAVQEAVAATLVSLEAALRARAVAGGG